jgi:uncharacterized protein (TIGR00288 family)
MQEKLNIAVFVDYDNIEIGVKSTLRREFDVALPLDALKERGDIIAKFAYANWGRAEPATRRMAENAVQMVQRIPSPRGDKNGADINLALDALEMAFTHNHVNAFAIVSGDSDFIPLVNKLKEYGKIVFVVGGKAFTSTILQQNCHEFISYESLLDEPRDSRPQRQHQPQHQAQLPPQQQAPSSQQPQQQPSSAPSQQPQRQPRHRPAPLDLAQAMPLVERALQVLERREVQPQLGLLKSTMLQLDARFSEKAYGAGSFSDFVEKLKRADYVELGGPEGRYTIQRKESQPPAKPAAQPDEALPLLRDVLEMHRLDMENGVPADHLESWVREASAEFSPTTYGFQEFAEFLNYAQDKLLVRIEPDEDKGLQIFLGAEFYPPAPQEKPPATEPVEPVDEPQPIVEGQPSMLEPEPPPVKKPTRRKAAPRSGSSGAKRTTTRAPRKRKTPPPPGVMQ